MLGLNGSPEDAGNRSPHGEAGNVEFLRQIENGAAANREVPHRGAHSTPLRTKGLAPICACLGVADYRPEAHSSEHCLSYHPRACHIDVQLPETYSFRVSGGYLAWVAALRSAASSNLVLQKGVVPKLLDAIETPELSSGSGRTQGRQM